MDPFNRKFQAALFFDKRLLERRMPSGLTNKDMGDLVDDLVDVLIQNQSW